MANSKSKSPLFQLFAPVLIALGFVFLGAHKVLIGWWAGPLLANKNYKLFVTEIHENVSFLFTQYGARIASREGIALRPGFDYAIVVVIVENFLLRFVRGRQEFRVDIAPKNSPTSWQDLESVLSFLGITDQNRRRVQFYGLRDFEILLKKHFDQLRHVMSAEQYANLAASQSLIKLIPL